MFSQLKYIILSFDSLIFHFLATHFGWLVFVFIVFCGPIDYVYRIWLSLVQVSETIF